MGCSHSTLLPSKVKLERARLGRLAVSRASKDHYVPVYHMDVTPLDSRPVCLTTGGVFALGVCCTGRKESTWGYVAASLEEGKLLVPLTAGVRDEASASVVVVVVVIVVAEAAAAIVVVAVVVVVVVAATAAAAVIVVAVVIVVIVAVAALVVVIEVLSEVAVVLLPSLSIS